MRRIRGCRCRATSTSATKESGSTGGTPAATTESKKSSESVGVHESTSGSSSEGKQLKKRVTLESLLLWEARAQVSLVKEMVQRYAGRLRDCSRVESYSCKHNWPQHCTSL